MSYEIMIQDSADPRKDASSSPRTSSFETVLILVSPPALSTAVVSPGGGPACACPDSSHEVSAFGSEGDASLCWRMVPLRSWSLTRVSMMHAVRGQSHAFAAADMTYAGQRMPRSDY